MKPLRPTYHRTGFCVWAKRLEQGRLVSDWCSMRDRQMDWTELKLLLEGIEPGRRRKRYEMPSNSAKTSTCARR
ncbi:IS66 family insertion sequence element accessory protein TnpB [Pseudomonas wenzhouensis]|nr:IS66 family insertion sequence element accessory protein TnpB [Pseudomonas wenzhouensis]MDM9654086.1 IS66 family insertion sequence element accessory protein TnpB [Pseudomonas wenzhouensis]